MNLPVTFERAADAEVISVAQYYETEREGLGIRFLKEIDQAAQRISEHPLGWPTVTERSRRYRLDRFPYGLIYQIRTKEIALIAVMHLHRKPEYWRNRER
jgi:plasmid stabilization system protein ParE